MLNNSIATGDEVIAMTMPPCTENPLLWDLDQAASDELRQAIDICSHCPLRARCTRLAEQLRANGLPPRAQVFAGTGFDERGAPLTYAQTLDYAASRRGPRARVQPAA